MVMKTMTKPSDQALDDRMDQLVAEYADALVSGRTSDRDDLLSQVPEEHRVALGRCLDMIDQGGPGEPLARRPLGPGSELGGFRIRDVLGRGGMAVVYRAEQPELDRVVALKVLRPGLALERRHVDRFHREALAIARLDHPNIVKVHAVGEADGYHFIAMECVDGPNLGEVFEQLPRDRAWSADDLASCTGDSALASYPSYAQAFAALMAPVARAVGVAHDLGIVHRDVKPSNILLSRDGRVRIADFGLAKGQGELEMTLTGEPLGTPYYMSPEQVTQSEAVIDARTDVYSLGVTLYEGLAGQRPFEGRSLAAIFDAIRNETPPPLRQFQSVAPRDAQAVVSRAMAREAGARYRSALELATDLAALAAGETTQARAQERPGWRSGLSAIGRSMLPGKFRYTSRTHLLGWPLLSVNKGGGQEGIHVAKGWLAFGDVAVGFLSMGQVATGVISLGGLSFGLLALGGLALGGVSLGGLSGGLLAMGGMCAGYVAIGGMSLGMYAAGGLAFGKAVMHGRQVDSEAVEWFQANLPWFIELIERVGGVSASQW